LLSSELTHDYLLYGLRLRSTLRLTLDDIPHEGNADLELSPGDPDRFEDAVSQVQLDGDWIHIHEIAGAWTYVRYDGMFHFLISPAGNHVLYGLLAEATLESFQTYALGRIFSFALVKMGYEPLHAATVVVNHRAVAFMGASGFGKSSLAACFVASGHPLLTDDVLRWEERSGQCVAFPGPPRLKLLPKVARLYLGEASVGIRINNRDLRVSKCVFSLPHAQTCSEPTPLAAIYVVTNPRKVYKKQRIGVRPFPPVEGLVQLLTFTHNHELAGAARLARQFDAARQLMERVPIRSLSYPRVLSSLSEVKSAVLADLSVLLESA
jgi:hypothetical protein